MIYDDGYVQLLLVTKSGQAYIYSVLHSGTVKRCLDLNILYFFYSILFFYFDSVLRILN